MMAHDPHVARFIQQSMHAAATLLSFTPNPGIVPPTSVINALPLEDRSDLLLDLVGIDIQQDLDDGNLVGYNIEFKNDRVDVFLTVAQRLEYMKIDMKIGE